MTSKCLIAREETRSLCVVLLMALVVRLCAALVLGNTVSGLSGAHDEISYSMLGHRIATGHGMTFPEGWYPWIQPEAPQSYYSATFTLGLGAVYWVFGYYPLIARLLMALMSTAVVLMLYVVTKDFFGQRVALVTATIATFYAYLVFYGVTLVTETPFTLAILLAIHLVHRMRGATSFRVALGLGACLALAVLLRMAVVFFVPVLLAWLAMNLKGRERWYSTAVPILCIIMAVLPFTVRNYRLWGQFLLLESQFGHVFWNGNHPGHLGQFSNAVFPIPADVLALRNDALMTNRLLVLGVQNVLADPVHFANLTLDRARIFFSFLPTSDTGRLENLGRLLSFGVVFPAALAGMWLTRQRWRSLLPVYLFILLHTSIYLLTWSMVRYRVPLDGFFIAFSAVTLLTVLDKLNARPRSVGRPPTEAEGAG